MNNDMVELALTYEEFRYLCDIHGQFYTVIEMPSNLYTKLDNLHEQLFGEAACELDPLHTFKKGTLEVITTPTDD